jgi:hypothetical protein
MAFNLEEWSKLSEAECERRALDIDIVGIFGGSALEPISYT